MAELEARALNPRQWRASHAYATGTRGGPARRRSPLVEIDDARYILLTPQLAGIGGTELGPVVANLIEQRQIIVAAIDFLITGS